MFGRRDSKFKSDAVMLVNRLAEVAISLSSEKDHGKLLELILLEAKDIARADGGTLYEVNEYDQLVYRIMRTDSLHICYGGQGFAEAPNDPISLYDEAGQPKMSTQVVRAVISGETINIPDVYHYAGGFDFSGTQRFDKQMDYRTKSVLTIPLINHKKEAIGCLQLVNAQDEQSGEIIAFSEEIAQIVHALASQAAVILDNRQLIEGQKKLLESFIQIIAQSIDAKSPYTGNHCERVPVLTEMIAHAACEVKEGTFAHFDMTDEEKYELHIAGWLHDCGKVVTPVHIMDKSTKLETIHDRIHEVLTRLEVLKRDAKIAFLEAQIEDPAQEARLRQDYEEARMQLEEDQHFLERVNIGGEFMKQEDVDRISALARRAWQLKSETLPLLHEDELMNLSIRKGTINPEEREIMNDHMVHTVNMLESMPWPKHLQRVPEYACGHHEKMDGTGYPKGLLAGTMSLPARMMAIADVFEALTAADRPYKPAKKLSEAMQIIGHLKRCNHLDPELVDFFVTSGVYKAYAEKFLPDEQIDKVNEATILAIVPDPMRLREKS